MLIFLTFRFIHFLRVIKRGRGRRERDHPFFHSLPHTYGSQAGLGQTQSRCPSDWHATLAQQPKLLGHHPGSAADSCSWSRAARALGRDPGVKNISWIHCDINFQTTQTRSIWLKLRYSTITLKWEINLTILSSYICVAFCKLNKNNSHNNL